MSSAAAEWATRNMEDVALVKKRAPGFRPAPGEATVNYGVGVPPWLFVRIIVAFDMNLPAPAALLVSTW